MSAATDDLAGTRVLIVEDDGLLSMLLHELLTAMGCVVVGTASRLEDAARRCEAGGMDLVLLDVNLRGEQTLDLAQTMLERGQAFVLATGYSATILPDALRAVSLLQKPFRRRDLENALWDALHSAAAG